MEDYQITSEKLKEISAKFQVSQKTVDAIYELFLDVTRGVKNQYLAHIIRSMEAYIRRETGNQMFQINCIPLDPDSPVVNVGCAQYFPKRFFSIFFHPGMDERQLRVCLAHELGHLFIVELLNESRIDETKTFDKKTLTEPLSSIFGVFTIMDKNDFYEAHGKLLNHKSWKAIVEDFVFLQDRIKN